MSKIYKLKEGKDLSDCVALEDYGFEINPIAEVVTKVVNQPLDGEAVNFLLKELYNNPGWKEKFYKPNKKMFIKEYNLKYNKKGEIIYNDEIKEFLTTWFCIIDLEDGWVGFTHCDKRNKMIYYGAKIIEKYCPKELFNLLASGLVEEAEVEEE